MIGILDSGIGGVTVLKQIRKRLKNQHYIYYSDSKNNPYGEKTEEEIYHIVKEIVEKLLQRGCHTIVIACNTASAVCIDKLRKEYKNINLVAIEPAIKVVKDGNYKGLTLVLATPATIKSKKFLNTFEQYKTKESILVECPNLANYIEKKTKKKLMNTLKI